MLLLDRQNVTHPISSQPSCSAALHAVTHPVGAARSANHGIIKATSRVDCTRHDAGSHVTPSDWQSAVDASGRDVGLHPTLTGVPTHHVGNSAITDLLFRGISAWPSVTRALHIQAATIINAEGVGPFIRYGGHLRRDGLVSFDRASCKTQEAIYRIVACSPGFVELDDCGTAWITSPLPVISQRGAWEGWAVSYPDHPELLDPLLRRPLCGRHPTACDGGGQTGRRSAPVDPLAYHAELVDRALKLAVSLADQVDDNDECIICFSDWVYSAEQRAKPMASLVEQLSALSRLVICRIDLAPDDEAGWIKRRSMAVMQFELLDDCRIRVVASPDLGLVLNHFAAIDGTPSFRG